MSISTDAYSVLANYLENELRNHHWQDEEPDEFGNPIVTAEELKSALADVIELLRIAPELVQTTY